MGSAVSRKKKKKFKLEQQETMKVSKDNFKRANVKEISPTKYIRICISTIHIVKINN